MYLAFGLLLFYSLVLIWMTVQWAKHTNLKGTLSEPMACSVLVPFRNEAKNLEALVHALNSQTHPNFEVVFIDDHSEDSGVEILYEFLATNELKARVISLSDSSGKKAALKLGIETARHELIVTTDADCLMKPQWLESLIVPFQSKSVQMVLGSVMLVGKSIWEEIQSIEFSPLIGVTGVMAKAGKPVMANGANLAYRKSAFQAVEGFNNIESSPSGDDELLMNKLQKHFGKAIVFNGSPNALVETAAFERWGQFRNQRIRWASKWKLAARPMTIFTALVIVLIQLAQVSAYWWLVQNQAVVLFSAVLALKLLSELIFISSVRSHFGHRTYIHYFLLCFILYPFYAIYFGIAANFKNFEWKGRNYPSIVR